MDRREGSQDDGSDDEIDERRPWIEISDTIEVIPKT
jgi:hypothetical protein